MRRSQVNVAFQEAISCFSRYHWALPANLQWDITDFGLGRFEEVGLVLVNLTTEPEYCEKLMFARRGQLTPCHSHRRKKEDIICRVGELVLRLWPIRPDSGAELPASFAVPINGIPTNVATSAQVTLAAGSRVTLVPGVWHEFAPASDECVVGEVSTANDDLHDNFFLDPAIGRFPGIVEDEPALVRLVSEFIR